MAGGAGSIGGSGGMGQQPMGNAGAQPGGGGFGPGVNNFGGGMGNSSVFETSYPTGGAPRQSTNQSTFGQGMNTMFGMLGQQPMQNPFGPSQPTPMQMPQPGSQTPSWAGGYLGQQQMPQPMGQRPAYMDNPDFQAYQKQEQDLGRQMNEYMQKAPMYQQLQDLQGKLRGFQQPQGQMGDTGFNRPMPAVMPQQPDPGMMGEMGLFTPETYGGRGGYGGRMGGYGRQMPQPPGSESVADNRMGMPDYGRGSMDMPSPENVAPEIGIGDFMQRQFPAPRMGGGFGRRGMGGGYGGRMGGGYGGQMGGLQGLASILQGRRGGF